jgi:hypothetical protein
MNTVTTRAEAQTFEEHAATAWPALYRRAYLLAGNHADAEDTALTGADSPRAHRRRVTARCLRRVS